MERPPIRFLMTAIVQEQDVDVAERALALLDVPITHLASTGGFLGRRNATLMIGIPEGAEEKVLAALRQSCRQRVEYLAIPLEGSPLPLPTPVPVTVGGAKVFAIPVERYEEI
ncbi:MAG TPA: cyclic-di-AMP receptor [Anaerolineales bacterium]|nr:cyclic-di-AMP receptor [Anaerolineales bacterium]